jgi:Spy/CpxP family protein refolding chaperone
MTSMKVTAALFALAVGSQIGIAESADSPYVGQEDRAIKALDAKDVDGLLAGSGMGYAKAAELNGYPGPMHVLELAEKLNLTTEQIAATRAAETAMRAEAKSLGAELVEAEKRLDALFASRTIDEQLLGASLKKIGNLQTQLRQTHLRAHLEQAKLLDRVQTQQYFALRGYNRAPSRHDPSAHGHH